MLGGNSLNRAFSAWQFDAPCRNYMVFIKRIMGASLILPSHSPSHQGASIHHNLVSCQKIQSPPRLLLGRFPYNGLSALLSRAFERHRTRGTRYTQHPLFVNQMRFTRSRIFHSKPLAFSAFKKMWIFTRFSPATPDLSRSRQKSRGRRIVCTASAHSYGVPAHTRSSPEGSPP
jgi:hypothetical protein